MKKAFSGLYKWFFVKIRRIHYWILSVNSYVGVKPVISQPVLFAGKGRIVFLGRSVFGYEKSPMYFSTYCHIEARDKASEIIFEGESIINNNFSVIASQGRIYLGKSLRIGRNCKIVNSDFHNVDPLRRNVQPFPCEDVTIGSNVFIGNDVTILKGVNIGENSTIGSGSLVVKSIPANSIAAGVPAKIIKQFDDYSI